MGSGLGCHKSRNSPSTNNDDGCFVRIEVPARYTTLHWKGGNRYVSWESPNVLALWGLAITEIVNIWLSGNLAISSWSEGHLGCRLDRLTHSTCLYLCRVFLGGPWVCQWCRYRRQVRTCSRVEEKGKGVLVSIDICILRGSIYRTKRLPTRGHGRYSLCLLWMLWPICAGCRAMNEMGEDE